MAKKAVEPNKAKRQSDFFLIAGGAFLGVFLVSLLLDRPSPADISSGDPSRTVPIESDPAAAEQNGQSLTNDAKEEQDQSLQETQQIPQSSESNLQGSPSTQSAAPLE